MKFLYKVVSENEVNPGILAALALKRKPFLFWYDKGTLLINAAVKPLDRVIEVLSAWWRHDIIGDDETEQEFDRLYKELSSTAGEDAAAQAWDAWRNAADASRKAKAREKADRFLSEKWEGAYEDELDAMEGYDYEFLATLFSEAAERGKKDHRYKDYFQVGRDAIFLYAFNCGVESARRAELKSATGKQLRNATK